jgi:general secretion pathway protein G
MMRRCARTAEPQRGFTLIELVMVIVLLGVVAGLAVPKVSGLLEETRRAATLKEMVAIAGAITGDASEVAAGAPVSRGYEPDVGALPASLSDLVTRPAGIPAWDRHTQTGWNGPYVRSDGGYLTDAWDQPYEYDALLREIRSTAGGAGEIVIRF